MAPEAPNSRPESPRAPDQQPGGPGLLTNNQGALRLLTGNQGAPDPLTDDQSSRARGPLIQILNNLYAKPNCEKSKSFDLEVATPGPSLTLL